MRALWIGAAFAASAWAHPMTAVVKILEDMLEQFDKDEKIEADAHKRNMCDLADLIKESEQTIEDQTAIIKAAKATITAQTARQAELETKKGIREAEVEKLTTELHAAIAERAKEEDKYDFDITNLDETILALGQAITLLKEKNDYKGLEETAAMNEAKRASNKKDKEEMEAAVAASKQAKFLQIKSYAGKVATLTKNKKLQNLLDGFVFPGVVNDSTSFLQTPVYQKYAAQSSQIFGMLQEMDIQFKQERKATKEAETNAIAAHTEYSTTTNRLIHLAMKDINENLIPGISDAEAKKAQAVEDEATAQTTLDAARTTLATAQETKAADEATHAASVQNRGEERASVQETIAILDDPKAFDATEKTVENVAPTFLQLSSADSRKRRMSRVVQMLSPMSETADIALVQAYAQSGAAFDKVLDAIVAVIRKIDAEAKSDAKAKLECTATQTTLEDSVKSLASQVQTQSIELDAINQTIDVLRHTVKAYKDAHAAEKETMKRLASDRALNNDNFQTAIAEQRATQEVLGRAIARLKQKYGGAGFDFASFKSALDMEYVEDMAGAVGSYYESAGMDTSSPEWGYAQDQEARVKSIPTNEKRAKYLTDLKYDVPSKNSNGNKVINLLQGILGKSKGTEKSLLETERSEQRGYETTTQNSNVMMRGLEEEIVKKEAALSKKEEEGASKEEELQTTKDQQAAEEDVLKSHLQMCKFIQDNFAMRETQRAAETKMLNEATAAIQQMQGRDIKVADSGIGEHTVVDSPLEAEAKAAEAKAAGGDHDGTF